jgi:hypothetical protein
MVLTGFTFSFITEGMLTDSLRNLFSTGCLCIAPIDGAYKNIDASSATLFM